MKKLLWKLLRNGGLGLALAYVLVSIARKPEVPALVCSLFWLFLVFATIATHKFPEGHIGNATASRWFSLKPLARLLFLVSAVWMLLAYFVQSGETPRMGIVVMPAMALWALYFGFKHLVIAKPDEALDPGMEKLLDDIGLGLDGGHQQGADQSDPLGNAGGSIRHASVQEHIPDPKDRERAMDDLIRRMKGAGE
ncbi:hypothetical protein [Aquabacterium sp.]|uniref:hypothetical protein n=1 Tax=Aquabacterium sp. TaxID=1872578 RepID=UPI003D6D27D0